MTIKFAASLVCIVAVLVYFAVHWRRKGDDWSTALNGVAATVGAVGGMSVGLMTLFYPVVQHWWPTFCTDFYGGWLTDPIYVVLSAAVYMAIGILALSRVVKTFAEPPAPGAAPPK